MPPQARGFLDWITASAEHGGALATAPETIAGMADEPEMTFDELERGAFASPFFIV